MRSSKSSSGVRLSPEQIAARKKRLKTRPAWNYQQAKIIREWRSLLDRSDVLIVDTETTGLGNRAEVVEVAALDTTGAVRFEALSMPQGSIPGDASGIHGLTRAKLKREGAKAWPEIHDEVVELLKPAYRVVAYNAKFDIRLLYQTAERHGLRMPRKLWFDVLEDYQALRRGGRHRLIDAVRREGVKIEGKAHRALYDCRCVLAVMRAVTVDAPA